MSPVEREALDPTGRPSVVTTSVVTTDCADRLLAGAATLSEALQQAGRRLAEAGCDTPGLDAEVLLAHTLGISRSALLARLREPLPATARSTFARRIRRRLKHEPVAYLTHERAFFGLDFYVDHRALIPRPETELLVERALAIANSQLTIPNSQFTIADVGTGSGCIAVALAVHLPQASIHATDVSPAALQVARMNVERHQVAGRVRTSPGDLLGALEARLKFDMLVANLPYVSEAEVAGLAPTVRDFEPVERALKAGPDGLDLIRRLLAQARPHLHPGGTLLLEIGAAQGAAVTEIARHHFPRAAVTVLPDLAGLDRLVEIHTKGDG